jgi:hypothetical protein
VASDGECLGDSLIVLLEEACGSVFKDFIFVQCSNGRGKRII